MLLYTKMQVFCLALIFSLPLFLSCLFLPFLISFQSLVGHQDISGRRNHGLLCVHSLKCPEQHLPPLPPVCTLDQWLLFWRKLHPSTLTCFLTRCLLALSHSLPVTLLQCSDSLATSFQVSWTALAATGVWKVKGCFPGCRVSFSLICLV